jgi:hypothetical protein
MKTITVPVRFYVDASARITEYHNPAYATIRVDSISAVMAEDNAKLRSIFANNIRICTSMTLDEITQAIEKAEKGETNEPVS